MERFAFKINGALKQNLYYDTCRLCGIDNPDKVPIIEPGEGNLDDGEPRLSKKIADCIGYVILKNDKMPQSACSLCVDKINDFYEFREMCYTTNDQMRKLLGLRTEQLKTEDVPPWKEKPCRKRHLHEPMLMMRENLANLIPKQEEVPYDAKSMKKMRLTGKSLANDKIPPQMMHLDKKINLKFMCRICNANFKNNNQLKQHLNIIHAPGIPRYFCTACDEAIVKGIDIKNHHQWHKLSKTHYACPLCKKCPSTLYAFSRHIKEHNQEFVFAETNPSRMCLQCWEHFETAYLFNTHSCVLELKKCIGCGVDMKNKADYMRHAPFCALLYTIYTDEVRHQVYVPPDTQLPPKKEHATDESFASRVIYDKQNVNMSTHSSEELRRIKSLKKTMLQDDIKRVENLLKCTIDTFASIKHEPDIQLDVTDTQLQLSEHAMHSPLEKQSNSSRTTSDNDMGQSAVLIKQERIEDDACAAEDSHDNVDFAINIKAECRSSDGEESEPAPLAQPCPVPRIKIKKEHGTLNSSLIQEVRKKRKLQNPEVSAPLQHIKEEACEALSPPLTLVEEERKSLEANVMTAIPMAQLQISCVSGGVRFGDDYGADNGQHEGTAERDVKPNLQELKQLMQAHSESNQQCIREPDTVAIKLEPQFRGYSDELHGCAQVTHDDSLDLANVHIKQEIQDDDVEDGRMSEYEDAADIEKNAIKVETLNCPESNCERVSGSMHRKDCDAHAWQDKIRIESIEVGVSEPPEIALKAQPLAGDSTEDHDSVEAGLVACSISEEEEQNVLNEEVGSQGGGADTLTLSDVAIMDAEEHDNRLNEGVMSLGRQSSVPAKDARDDHAEIAENNNNANLEREQQNGEHSSQAADQTPTMTNDESHGLL